MQKRSAKSWGIRFHPLTIMAISLITPVFSTLFASWRCLAFFLAFSLSLLFLTGNFRAFVKALAYLGLFGLLYMLARAILPYSGFVTMFQVLLAFLPCGVMAVLLAGEYNASQMLSALQVLPLPKMAIIGLTVTLRYIPTFRKEWAIIKEAMALRGIQMSWRRPVHSFSYMLVPQLFRAVALSGELSCAGVTKGLGAPNRRSSYYQQGFGWPDAAGLAVFALGCMWMGGWL